MKKAIQFLKKIGNAIWVHMRSLASRKITQWCALFLGICIFMGVFALSLSGAVKHRMASRITTVEALVESQEHFDLIIVLGCSVHPDGTLSHMLEDRVTTGVSLWKAGLAETILMSGDRHDGYDEVGAMEGEAKRQGVPAEKIVIDPEGYSTYDSIVNLLDEYKGKRVLIVTQQYHLYRALYIAEKFGIEAYGISADLRTYRKQLKYDLREVLARVKDVLWVQYNLK